MKKIKIATVFSGIGAAEFAFKRLSIPFEIVFACDNGERDVEYNHAEEFQKITHMSSVDEKQSYVEELYSRLTRKTNFVEKTYLANFNCPKNRYFQDINLLDGNDFKGKVDLLIGGSPCQSFSSVGFKGGLDDARGTLFYEYARLLTEIEPEIFIYENVRNLINHDNGKTWKVIQSVFDSLNYSYQYFILNSSDFNIPQTRRRLFVIGFKNSPCDLNIKSIPLKYSMNDFLLENCSYGNFKRERDGSLQIIKSYEKVDNKYYLSPLLYKYVMSPGTKNWKTKIEINKPIARTLLKTMGNHHRAGVDNYVSINNSLSLGDVRMLTEREALRLMGFTDDFVIPVSKCQAYKQAGNAIVVDVMIAIIKCLIKNKRELFYVCKKNNSN